MLRRALLALTVVAAVGPACGSEDSSDPPTVPDSGPVATGASPPATEVVATAAPPPGATEPVLVQALDNTFRPQVVTVAVGTEVVFDNVGRNDHDVIPLDDAVWGVEVEAFAPGDTYSHRFTEPGTYEYVCTIHGVAGVGMIGTIIVE